MSSTHRVKYADLVDVAQLQALMQSFCEVIGVANAVIDVDGSVIARAGWQSACTDFHRVHAETCRRCIESDTSLAGRMTLGAAFAVYRCHNGLVDTAAPIVVSGVHLANVFTGQFLTEPPDLAFFRAQAQQFGFDEARYLEAIALLPVLPRARVESVTRLYAQLAALLADSGLSRLQQIELSQQLAGLNASLEQQVAQRTQALAQANEQLAARESLLQQVLDTSSAAIFLLDQQGCISMANQRMGEMFGTTVQSLLGRDYALLIHPDERDIGRHRMHDLLNRSVDSSSLERLYWRADHTPFWGHLSGRRFHDAYGHDQGLVGVIIDITESKKLQDAVQENREKYRALSEAAFEAVFISEKGLCLEQNRRAEHMFGYTDEEALGQPGTRWIAPEDRERVLAHMMSGYELPYEVTALRKDGSTFAALVHGKMMHYRGRNVRVTSMSDISERKAAQDQINALAFYDPLTQLPNRRLLLDRLTQALAATARHQHEGALLFIDLDKFKTLNDSFGHSIGDLLLEQVARRLLSCIREVDTAARLGGDEFVVLLENLSESAPEAAAQAQAIGAKILAAMAQPFSLAGFDHRCSASIGITLFRDRDGSLDELLQRADQAMYQAKNAGRNTLRFFDPAMQAVK